MKTFTQAEHPKMLFIMFDSMFDVAKWARDNQDGSFTIDEIRDVDGRMRRNPKTSLIKRETPSIQELYDIVTTLGDPLGEWLEEIERLSYTLENDSSVPIGMTMRRKKEWRPHGGTLNIHRVNQGKLNRAWRATQRRELSMAQGNIVSVIVPCEYNMSVGAREIRWAMSATLALVNVLEQKGVRSEIIGFGHTDQGWAKGTCTQGRHIRDYATLTELKAPDQPWNIQDCVALLHEGIVRRFFFRMQECLGVPPLGYGRAPVSDADFEEKARKYIPCFDRPINENAVMGAMFGSIYDFETALEWVKTQNSMFDLAHTL